MIEKIRNKMIGNVRKNIEHHSREELEKLFAKKVIEGLFSYPLALVLAMLCFVIGLSVGIEIGICL